jgi:hypothetical protein
LDEPAHGSPELVEEDPNESKEVGALPALPFFVGAAGLVT